MLPDALAHAAHYRSLGTFEFLVDGASRRASISSRPTRACRVEHTVTEVVTGLDLVELQLRLAAGATLAELGLAGGAGPAPRGMAMQLRINVETMQPDGTAKPGGGVARARSNRPPARIFASTAMAMPATRPIRPTILLLAKLIVFARSGSDRGRDGQGLPRLCEFNIAGVPTNIAFLQAVLLDKDVRAGTLWTGFVEANAPALLAMGAAAHPRLYAAAKQDRKRGARAGAKVDAADPLSVLAYGRAAREAGRDRMPAPGGGEDLPDGMIAVRTPMQGTVISISVAVGDTVPAGAEVAVMEAMKDGARHHGERLAASSGRVHVERRVIHSGKTSCCSLEPSEVAAKVVGGTDELDLDAIRPDLARCWHVGARTRDENRQDAVKRRHRTNHRTARENVADLIDPGTFVEYGPLIIAAQRQRRTLNDLLDPQPGRWPGRRRRPRERAHVRRARHGVAVMAYDYTVFAGTQGVHNHWKTDKILDIAEDGRMPLVLFAEGGGGRPGDDDYGGFIQFDTFHHFGSALGSRAADRHRLRSLLRGQCVAARLLRRRSSPRPIPRSAWAARQWSRAAASACSRRGDRTDVGADAQRRRRHPGRRRSRGRHRRQADTSPISRDPEGLDRAGSAADAPYRAGEPATHLRGARRHPRRWPTKGRCSSCAATSGARW